MMLGNMGKAKFLFKLISIFIKTVGATLGIAPTANKIPKKITANSILHMFHKLCQRKYFICNISQHEQEITR